MDDGFTFSIWETSTGLSGFLGSLFFKHYSTVLPGCRLMMSSLLLLACARKEILAPGRTRAHTSSRGAADPLVPGKAFPVTRPQLHPRVHVQTLQYISIYSTNTDQSDSTVSTQWLPMKAHSITVHSHRTYFAHLQYTSQLTKLAHTNYTDM